jgi:GAF domain-containing protein
MSINPYLKEEVARLRGENEALREELASLRPVAEALRDLVSAVDRLTPGDDPLAFLDQVLYDALSIIGTEEGSLLVPDDDTEELVFVLSHGPTRERVTGRRMPADKGIAGWVLAHRRPALVNDAYADDRFYAGIDEAVGYRTRSVLAAPLTGGSRIHGVIELINKQNGERFTEHDHNLLTLLCRFAGEMVNVVLQEEQEEA